MKRRMQGSCVGCGAPISVGTCNYCGEVVDAPEPKRRRVKGDWNRYDVLRNVDLIGDRNIIGEAHNCTISGDWNRVDWADASTLATGDRNTVKQPRRVEPHLTGNAVSRFFGTSPRNLLVFSLMMGLMGLTMWLSDAVIVLTP